MPANARRAAWVAVAVAAIAAAPFLAGSPALAGQDSGGHVRGVDSRAQGLILRAIELSPTIVALVRHLDESDVFVMVQLAFMHGSISGDLRMLGAAACCRYLVVRVDLQRSPDEQIECLAHELQHANEVADSPDVRDEVTLAGLMARTGRKTGAGTYETDAAVLVTRVVRAELRGGRL